MGIYIPGKMPKDGECIVVYGDGEVWHHGKRITKVGTAVELPPHGRLGDLDALTHTIERVPWYHQNEEKDMVHGANSFLHQAWYKEQDIYEAIENADTIIPASGGADCAC